MTSVSTAPQSRSRLVAGAVATILAPWGFVVSNAAYYLAIRDGGNDETGAASLALAGAHPVLSRVAILGAMVGSLLVIPAVLTTLTATRSRLAFVGGSMMIAGYVCYFSVAQSGFTVLAMAERGGPMADYAAVIDASQMNPWAAWVFLLFVAGNLLGTLLFATGLLRSRAVPVWAAVGILLWPVLHITGLVFFGNEVPQVIGATTQALGFAGIAMTVLRRRAVPSLEQPRMAVAG